MLFSIDGPVTSRPFACGSSRLPSGSVKARSTRISWQVTMSNASSTSDSIMCQERSWSPGYGGGVGMPQPSSALWYSGAAPMLHRCQFGNLVLHGRIPRPAAHAVDDREGDQEVVPNCPHRARAKPWARIAELTTRREA
jgi:hypothetical protein